MAIGEQSTNFEDGPAVGALIIAAMLTISIVAAIYICFLAR